MSLGEKNALKGSTKLRNEKYIFHAGIFDQEKPRTVGRLCSLLRMDIAVLLGKCVQHTLSVGRKSNLSLSRGKRVAEDKESHKIVINYEN